MKKEAYEVEYYEPKSVLAMQADRREEKHRRKQKKGIRAGRILLGVAILLFWEVSARLGWIDDYYWSSPSLIAQTAIVQWKEKNLAYDIYFTSMSTIGGFLAGTLGGAVLGLSFWWSKTFAKIFEPYLVMFNAIPKLALAPILIVLFGIGFSSKVMLAFLMTVISCALATAACLMVKREIYEQAGGFEEQLAVAFNDVDFCLKVRRLGKLVVYEPHVQAYHYESKSRGAEDSPEKTARFQREIEYMRNHWIGILKNGDPYYNPNFSSVYNNYSLKDNS